MSPFHLPYQNTFSGDGAESFLAATGGVLVEAATNAVVADNDFSNMTDGIQIWNDGTDPSEVETFEIFADNSIHNVYIGLSIVYDSSTDTSPQFYCNSFSGNTINGLRNGPVLWAPYPAAILIQYSLNRTVSPPQALMNIFCGDTMVGTDLGLFLDDGNRTVPLGATVFDNDFFVSDGGSTATEIEFLHGDDGSDIVTSPTDSWQGFWNTGNL